MRATMHDTEPLHADETGYAVVLKRDHDGREFYAGSGNGVAFFYKRRQAVAFRNELHRSHGCGQGRVVKVRVRVEMV